MEHLSEIKFPVDANDYKLYEEVGEGVSATVYRALCIPLNEIVAIKVLDLERCNSDLDGIRCEVHTVTLIDHPCLVKAHCPFSHGHCLWVVMPYMAGGSCLQIMKFSYPEGFEEPVIATLLREVLKSLEYLHSNGLIHREIKSGNILVDSYGKVKMADFGVSACMFDTGSETVNGPEILSLELQAGMVLLISSLGLNIRGGLTLQIQFITRYVCLQLLRMAPEVMQQLHGYDFKADIWSFGITSLELAHGHAPFSKYTPMKVLLMTLQNAPPGLDYERDKRFSKSFKEMVAACLVKDPKKHPSAEKLLKHSFFKTARPTNYLARTILYDLPPLGDRFRMLKAQESEFLVQNKAHYEDKDQLSQQEYIRGISAWNFNLEDLKNKAALILDCDDGSNVENPVLGEAFMGGYNSILPGGISSERNKHPNVMLGAEHQHTDIPVLDGSLAVFPIKPLEALKGIFDVGEDNLMEGSPSWRDSVHSRSEQSSVPEVSDQEYGIHEGERAFLRTSVSLDTVSEQRNSFSESLSHNNAPSVKNDVDGLTGEYTHPRYDRNYNGPVLRQIRTIKSLATVEETSEGETVQRKGGLKLLQRRLRRYGPNIFGSVHGGSTSATAPGIAAASILPLLHHILQQNTMQRDEIIKVVKYVEQTSVTSMEHNEARSNYISEITAASIKEKGLHSVLSNLQQSIENLIEELQTQKTINTQLEMQLKDIGKTRKESE